MAKPLFIAEKPSVAAEFAKALKMNGKRRDGYVESENGVVTWCVGHLVTMSYPEVYDERLKRWSLDTLPFIPEQFLYEVIPSVKKQFEIVKGLLNREDIDCIYVCTDSGREGEYIYRLVEQMAGVHGKQRKRVWIDSQTEEEILRGVREAKDLSEYDHLSEAAYLRAKEDYLMGINFSRLLTLKYGRNGFPFDAEWKVNPQSRYQGIPDLYKENGFKKKETAEELIHYLRQEVQHESEDMVMTITAVEKKKESKNPPLLYNLAEAQNECSKMFKISPDETLKIIQELYEKKLVTYPRTDARVLSTAVAKEIHKNIGGLRNLSEFKPFAEEILQSGSYKNIAKTRYVNDKQITDHYAIIPTGQGFSALKSLNPTAAKVYQVIVRRFLSIFYPAAVYQKINLTAQTPTGVNKEGQKYLENFNAGFKVLVEPGYLKVAQSYKKQKEEAENSDENINVDINIIERLKKLKKNDKLCVADWNIKEGETTPPKRYNSGSLILAMENAGQLIEDEELRAQIKGSGIGTSATRAEILKKLVNNQYICLNRKTQVIMPSQLGEMIHDVVGLSIRPLLNPELTASWEKGLTYVAEGTITGEEYMQKLDDFVRRRVYAVLSLNNQSVLRTYFEQISENYKK